MALSAKPATAVNTEKVNYSIGSGAHDLHHVDTDGPVDSHVYSLLHALDGGVSGTAIGSIQGKIYTWGPYEDTVFMSDLDRANRVVWLSTTVNINTLSAYNGSVYYSLATGNYDFIWRNADASNNVTIAAFAVSNLVISPAEDGSIGTVTISVDVANNGDSAGEYTLILIINDEIVTSKSVTLVAGGMKTVTFTVTGQAAGHYNVDLNGLTKDYEVIKASPAKMETITQTPSENNLPSSTTILLSTAPGESEDEEPVSWWLIVIIITGGLIVALVTWTLIRKTGKRV
ncbi:MAG: hypothetical protein A2Y89_02765 [Chloroflexi bacterium RBG_13_51_18]|nr:MAG: hypothetical protein A2Y89_02765 [Chloroflexi bacterium RBG_13_51_18]